MIFKFLFIILTILGTISCKLDIPSVNLTLSTGQLTPRGVDWPQFSPISGELILVDPREDCKIYENKIVFILTEPYIDNKIIFYKNCGAKGIVVYGLSSVVPGDSISIMENREPFMTRDNPYPVSDVTSTDGTKLYKILKNTTLMVTMDATDGNIWKQAFNSPSYYAASIVPGIITLVVTAWSIINVVRIYQTSMKYPKVPYIICSLTFVGSILRLLGFIDFKGWRQLYECRASIFLTSAGIGIIFSACWFMALLMLNTVDKSNIKIKLIMKRYLWPYIIITIILIAADWILSVLSITMISTPGAILIVSFIWIAVTTGLTLSLGIVFIIAFTKFTIVRRRSNIRGNKYDSMLKITVIINLIIGVCIVLYFILTIVAFVVGAIPYLGLIVFFTLPTILSIISLCLMLSIHLRITQQQLKSSVSSKSTGTDSKTGQTTV
ncbi:Transmembrane domain-containing protein [Orpheovirus IHUMI-LCC2]|uniref:Transmembrane domain-containing protein n=1 Tax=Orpheovirus IHUMI-LCC2 TaxID=2023057 RepID=A0A2I2L497_9VIRU|nr:Transmembrane domain-containing protein [Orpheovirus IHUMI-LCC2]SNW62330.1 Transmembrane domain-containing protein [Orpheovirus IHUMI-LCC2]